MVGIYFSGTGNTRHCVEKFVKEQDETSDIISIEEPGAISEIQKNDFIVFGYPTYYSNLPKIVHDFIINNQNHFKGKKIFIISTMGLFSGDGAGCSARLFKRSGADIIGGLHLKMPDCISDEKVLKKSLAKNKELISIADKKISVAVTRLKAGKAPKEGLNALYLIAGLLGQRLWFYYKTKQYSDKLHINPLKCIGCGKCRNICPMKNIELSEGKAKANGRCTMCYRCISQCPNQAITLLGKTIYEQCCFENYMD